MSTGEFDWIARLKSLYATRSPGVDVAIGDDAALLACANQKLAWTIDAQVEGVHFRRDLISWRDEGWRSFVAAASDLAAMGADPWCALSSLTLPREFTESALLELAHGIADAARSIGAPIIGGNLAAGSIVTLTTTLLGSNARRTTRDAARRGDGVWIAGRLGLAAAGFASLERKIASTDADEAIDAWRRPRPLFDAARAMRDVAHAAIDISDGLAQDAMQIARASDVTIELDADAILAHAGDALARVSRSLGREPLELALDGGEDYALLVTSDRAIAGFTRIGGVTSVGAALSLRRGGDVTALVPRGFDHFAHKP